VTNKLLIHGWVSGLLVEPGNPDALADAIAELLEDDELASIEIAD
jgi:glycosyltransferase involved in cell wall biosynthesis